MDAETQSTEVYLKVLEWLHVNRKQLTIGAVSVVVIAVVWGFMVYSKNQKDADANAAFFAVPIENTMRGEAVSPTPLLSVASEYQGTPGAEHAQIMAAQELFLQGKYPEAGAQFNQFIENYPDSVLIPQAKMGVAASLEAQGKINDAAQKYHDLILAYPSDMDVVSPAKLTLARLMQDAQPQQALGLYSELARMLSQNPYDPWAAEARERAQLLLFQHPELMEALTNSAAQAQGRPPSSGFSASDAAKAAAARQGAAPSPSMSITPQKSAGAPAGNQTQTPHLLSIPAPSNSPAKP
jgi:predicted negative regulator of RcsB-dependent stress response